MSASSSIKCGDSSLLICKILGGGKYLLKNYMKGHYWNTNYLVAIHSFAHGPENRSVSKGYVIL